MATGSLTFDMTINLGQVIEATVFVGTILVALGGGLVVFRGFGDRIDSVDRNVDKRIDGVHKRIDGVDAEMKRQTEILVSLGEQGARITNLETQLTLIQHKLLSA